MAFYKDVKGKTRREKQAVAQNRGGFDDEGSHYTGKYSFGKAGGSRNGEGKRYHDGSRSDERRFDGERSPTATIGITIASLMAAITARSPASVTAASAPVRNAASTATGTKAASSAPSPSRANTASPKTHLATRNGAAT